MDRTNRSRRRLVLAKLSGGKAPLPGLAEGRGPGLFQLIAYGAPVARHRATGGRTATRPQGGRKRLGPRPSKTVPKAVPKGHGKRYEHA